MGSISRRNLIKSALAVPAVGILGGKTVRASDSSSAPASPAAPVTTTPLGCDVFVALRDATADHSVLLGKNSDRPPMEAQPLIQMPHRTHAPGEKVKCTYIEIPQVAKTYEHFGSKLWWAFGYEQGMNEHGVAIGNTAVFSKEPMQWGNGLLGMDMLRLGLERSKTAYEAMHVILELLEKHGQCGDCEHPGEWGKANYHNSYILADPHEAWVLETAGKYWAAKRVRQGVYSISNIYSIESDWDEAHPRLVDHAVEKRWARSAGDFNMARDYGDYWTEKSKNPGDMQIRRNMTMACLGQDFSRATAASMMRINRNHMEGTIAEPRWGATETFWPTPCMHDNAHAHYTSVASFVAHLREEMPPLLRQVYWASFSSPCCNVFKPFYLGGPTVPSSYAEGTSTYSADSPWWWAKRLKLLCDLNYRTLQPAVRATFDATERWEMGRQVPVEAEALREIKAGKESAALKLLQQFTSENCERVAKEYKMLQETLPRMLETVGLDYLYTDYLKDWSSKKGVPLPLS
jgi:secernin